MSSEQDDDRGRQETPTGQSPYDQPSYGQPHLDRPQHEQSQYGQPQYGQSPYGQASYPPAYGQPQHGLPPYGQPPYGQPQYGQPQYAQPPYGQPYGAGPYGQAAFPPGQPARPGTVITAAVLGLVHGALGLLTAVALLTGGALLDDLIASLAAADPTIDPGAAATEIDSVRVALVLCGVLALAWTVVMVWGSVLALRGRSRVLLIVGAAIAVAGSGLVFLAGLAGAAGSPGEQGEAGAVLLLLGLFLAAVAMLVLICLGSAGRFFAAHRQRRALGLR